MFVRLRFGEVEKVFPFSLLIENGLKIVLKAPEAQSF